MLEFEMLSCLYHTGESAVFACDNDFSGLEGKRTATVGTADFLHYVAQAQPSDGGPFYRDLVLSHSCRSGTGVCPSPRSRAHFCSKSNQVTLRARFP